MFERSRWANGWIRILAVSAAILVAPALAWAGEGDAKDGEKEKKEEKIDPQAEFRRANSLASRNALTRSIPHYKKVIEAAPDRYPLAHFNLGEVYRVKGDCAPAVLAYQSYLVMGKSEESKEEARDAIEECIAKSGGHSGKLSVDITPDKFSKITIDGLILARGSDVEKLELLPGSYEVKAEADEHFAKTKSVEVEKGKTTEIAVTLERKTLFATLALDVDQDDAPATVSPLDLDAPDSPDAPQNPGFETTSPVEKPERLPTGKYFLEVTKEDYDRWIRNVYIKKDQETKVDIDMTRSLPEEIRGE